MAIETQSMGSGRDGHGAGWENVTTNVMSWGESWPYTEAPLVSNYKALEPRHMVQIVERFAENRTNGLQTAFFNGARPYPISISIFNSRIVGLVEVPPSIFRTFTGVNSRKVSKEVPPALPRKVHAQVLLSRVGEQATLHAC